MSEREEKKNPGKVDKIIEFVVGLVVVVAIFGLPLWIAWLSSSDIGPDWFQASVDWIANTIVQDYETGKRTGIGVGGY